MSFSTTYKNSKCCDLYQTCDLKQATGETSVTDERRLHKKYLLTDQLMWQKNKCKLL